MMPSFSNCIFGGEANSESQCIGVFPFDMYCKKGVLYPRGTWGCLGGVVQDNVHQAKVGTTVFVQVVWDTRSSSCVKVRCKDVRDVQVAQ